MLWPSDSFLNLQGSLSYTPSSGVSGVIISEDTILVGLAFTVLLGKGSAHLSTTVLLLAPPTPIWAISFLLGAWQLVRKEGDMEEEISTRGSM